MLSRNSAKTNPELGLVIQSTDKAPRVLMEYLRMFLNFRYGLELMEEKDVIGAAVQFKDQGEEMRCVFVIQDREIGSPTTVSALSRKGASPLFFLVPLDLVEPFNDFCKGMKNVYISDWDNLFTSKEPSISRIIETAFTRNKIRTLLDGAESLPYSALQEKVARQIQHLDALPALPDVMLRLMRLVRDPEARIEELEQIISSEPSIVWKLLEVMKTPAFAGRRRAEWTLREIIMRLGIRKVGAVVQQIMLMNSFVKPKDSSFDLRRFWEHSVGCASIADKLYTTRSISVETSLQFHHYWLGSLLHDIGKLVLGLFYPGHFENVISRINSSSDTGRNFWEIEAELGCVGLHEEIARLLLLKVDAGPSLVEAVGNHHAGIEAPSDLGSLVHVSNNICKDLGFGYLPKEKGVFEPSVLGRLNITESSIRSIEDSLGESMVGDIKKTVDLCLATRKKKKKRSQESPSDAEKAVSDTELYDRVFQLLSTMNDRLEQDTILSEERKSDLLVDIETLSAQLKKSTVDKGIVLVLVKSLARTESLRKLVEQLIHLLNQLKALADRS